MKLNTFIRNQAETLAFWVSFPWKSSTLTCWTREYHSFPDLLSSSFLFLEILTLILLGRFLIPWTQSAWLSLGSIRTSVVLIILETSVLMWVIARGAFFLKVSLWASLWMLMVVSIAVSVKPFLYSFFPITTNLLNINIKYLILSNCFKDRKIILLRSSLPGNCSFSPRKGFFASAEASSGHTR